MHGRLGLFALLMLIPGSALASGQIPRLAWEPDQVGHPISPPMGTGEKHNQPSIVNGYLLLAGNGVHSLWDIQDPFAPARLSQFESPHHDGEAESHQVAFARRDGAWLAAMISGRGVDLWDLSDATAPVLLSTLELEGVDYGDNTNAVWGLAWQGDALYVGGTSTGLWVVDTRDLAAPSVAQHLPTAALGGVSAGPTFAVGNLLVVTTPKNHAGIATLDISDPWSPALLDFVLPEQESYIGWFYGHQLHLISPWRSYDVTTDPGAIVLDAETETVKTEYLSFGDDRAFIGRLRPDPGSLIFDVPTRAEVGVVEGRREIANGLFTDDQFSLPVGNLLVVSDDEMFIGSTLSPHQAEVDSTPPRLLWQSPGDGASGLAPTSRIGLSFSDQIDLRSLSEETVILRPLDGGAQVAGQFAGHQTLVHFWPDQPLAEDTTYELILPAGGVTDLAGNPLVEEQRALFSTGADVAQLSCAIDPMAPARAGAALALSARLSEASALHWDFGDGQSARGGTELAALEHSYAEPGRYTVTLTVEGDGLARACSATAVVHAEPLSSPPLRSQRLLATPEGLWLAHREGGTLSLLDPESQEVLREFTPCATGEIGGLLLDTPEGAGAQLWLSCREDDALVALDPEDGAPLARLELGYGSAPGSLVSTGAGTAAVLLEGPGAVQRVVLAGCDEAPCGSPVPASSARRWLRGLVAHEQGLWFAPLIAPASGPVLRHQPGPGAALEEAHHLPPDTTPDSHVGGRGVPNYLLGMALSPSGRWLAVAASKANIERGGYRDGLPLNSQNTVRAMLSLIDRETGAEQRIDFDDRSLPSAVAFSEGGDLVFVALLGSHLVEVVETASGRRVGALPTGRGPDELLVVGDRLYVSNGLERSLSMFDIGDLVAGRSAAGRALGSFHAIEQEPLSPTLLLGRQLFHDARDPRISQDGYLSCASCHLEGADDGQVWDFTDRGEGLRKTIDLRGRGGTAQGPLHWTANFDEVQDFENDIRLAFGGSGLLAAEHWEDPAIADPLGSPKAGLSVELDALAAYVASFTTPPRSPWREADGGFSQEARWGATVFTQAGCRDCHDGAQLSDSGSARHDVGTFGPGSGQRIGGALDGLDTPGLHGVWARGPWLHDGAAATLDETLDHGAVERLDADERAWLVAFLASLDGAEPPAEPYPARGCRSCAHSQRDPSRRGGGWAVLVVLCLVARRRQKRRV